jgi:hypothetical protein
VTAKNRSRASIAFITLVTSSQKGSSIDPAARRATLQVTRRLRRLLRPPARIQVGGASDGGGLIIVGGRIIKVPPHSPLLPMVEALAACWTASQSAMGRPRDLIQRAALQHISDAATAQLHRRLAYHEPAPAPLERKEGTAR